MLWTCFKVITGSNFGQYPIGDNLLILQVNAVVVDHWRRQWRLSSLNYLPRKVNVFDVRVTVHRVKFLIINQLDALISQIYSWNETLHVSDSSSFHHQEFFTVHTAVVYVIQVCWQLASCQQTCMTYTIVVCTVKNSWWCTEELSETCRVSFQE